MLRSSALALALVLLATTPAGAATARRALTVPEGATARGAGFELRAARCRTVPRAAVLVDGDVVARRSITRRWRAGEVTSPLEAGRHRVAVRALGCRRVALRRVRAVGLAPVADRALPPPPAPPPPPPPPPALAALAAALPAVTADLEGLRLRQVPLGSAISWGRFHDDDALRSLFGREFNSVTPENEMKMAFVQPRPGEFDFADADALVRYARMRGKRVRGHTLVWHQQNPGWLTHGDWTEDELEAVLTDHVQTVVGHFRGRVDTWDVVNEPLEANGELRAGNAPWVPVLGEAYIETALRAARAADPEAKLFINEIAAEHAGPKLDALVELAADLRARGVPLDGIGLQNHTTVNGFPSRERLSETIARFTTLGLEVEITEMDVGTSTGSGSIEERLARQAEAYAAAAGACRDNPSCTRVTVWGLADHLSWLGPHERALPFDDALAPKPAWHALSP